MAGPAILSFWLVVSDCTLTPRGKSRSNHRRENQNKIKLKLFLNNFFVIGRLILSVCVCVGGGGGNDRKSFNKKTRCKARFLSDLIGSLSGNLDPIALRHAIRSSVIGWGSGLCVLYSRTNKLAPLRLSILFLHCSHCIVLYSPHKHQLLTPCQSEPFSRGNVSGNCRNLGSLRDRNETWHRLPCSLLRSVALLVQSEDYELMPQRRCVMWWRRQRPHSPS